jgi:hypothetical protein
MDDGHGQWDVERTRPPGDGPGAWSRYAATLEGSRGAMGFARNVAIRSRKTLVGSRGASRAAVARTRARIDESRRCVDVSRAALRRSMGIARSA